MKKEKFTPLVKDKKQTIISHGKNAGKTVVKKIIAKEILNTSSKKKLGKVIWDKLTEFIKKDN